MLGQLFPKLKDCIGNAENPDSAHSFCSYVHQDFSSVALMLVVLHERHHCARAEQSSYAFFSFLTTAAGYERAVSSQSNVASAVTTATAVCSSRSEELVALDALIATCSAPMGLLQACIQLVQAFKSAAGLGGSTSARMPWHACSVLKPFTPLLLPCVKALQGGAGP